MDITVGMSKGRTAPVLEPDTYPARLYMLVDLGTQDAEFKKADGSGGVDKRKVRKVRLGFEILGKTADFGQGKQEPYVVGKDYTASFGGPEKPSNLLKDIQAWRGKPFSKDELVAFSLNKLVGVPAFVSVVVEQSKKNGNPYAKIHAISKLPSSITPPPGTLAPVVYNIQEGAGGVFNTLPEFIKERIMASDEWKAAIAGAAKPSQPEPTKQEATPAPEDDVPF